MKKQLIILPLLCLMLTSVFAMDMNINVRLVQKNPADWSTVNGASANVLLSSRYLFDKDLGQRVMVSRASAILRNADPFSDYTLIYYGFQEFNDVWPYATCITSGVTNNNGNVRMLQEEFNYVPFLQDSLLDNKGQKFWVIKSSDIDCENHRMIAWNPEAYLFETEVI